MDPVPPGFPMRVRTMRRGLFLLLVLLPGLAVGQSPSEKRAAAEKLLETLRNAPNAEVAGALEARIQQLWVDGSTAAVTLLMHRGLRELQGGSHDAAIAAFGDAIVLDPTLAEAWHQRGVARYQGGDTPGAVVDLQETLKREPRSFAAWKTLAEIAAAREDWTGAYGAWRKLMEIDPKTPNGDERLRELKRKAVGEDT